MDDKTEVEIRRAERARLFLEDGIFQEAWDDLETRLVQGWRNAPAHDPEGREYIWRMLRTMDSLKETIQGFVEDGKHAEARLDMMAKERAIAGQ